MAALDGVFGVADGDALVEALFELAEDGVLEVVRELVHLRLGLLGRGDEAALLAEEGLDDAGLAAVDAAVVLGADSGGGDDLERLAGGALREAGEETALEGLEPAGGAGADGGTGELLEGLAVDGDGFGEAAVAEAELELAVDGGGGVVALGGGDCDGGDAEGAVALLLDAGGSVAAAAGTGVVGAFAVVVVEGGGAMGAGEDVEEEEGAVGSAALGGDVGLARLEGGGCCGRRSSRGGLACR